MEGFLHQALESPFGSMRRSKANEYLYLLLLLGGTEWFKKLGKISKSPVSIETEQLLELFKVSSSRIGSFPRRKLLLNASILKSILPEFGGTSK